MGDGANIPIGFSAFTYDMFVFEIPDKFCCGVTCKVHLKEFSHDLGFGFVRYHDFVLKAEAEWYSAVYVFAGFHLLEDRYV